ncbi:MAG: HAD family hydrolase, partial [Gammaproteobacteria bacterium]
MAVALFDLDNTLLAGDSDYEWGCFLADQGVVDREQYLAANRHFYQQYQAGTLDIHEFLAFQLRPLTEHDPTTLQRLRAAFVDQRIRPIVLPAACDLVKRHRDQGD